MNNIAKPGELVKYIGYIPDRMVGLGSYTRDIMNRKLIIGKTYEVISVNLELSLPESCGWYRIDLYGGKYSFPCVSFCLDFREYLVKTYGLR